ncbi:MAG: XRE family transcriptional regulator [Micavibrio aeruginosavorus]|uniref:XRE family transcriptional regulator n=1 Tax=Micavibrio aeruginosavorus TaxID=349221 RepID=A0A2W5PLM4_9BACT|nr:MAG: XRE family transcriptional regulator [Micavibrio aeruginosavorus]
MQYDIIHIAGKPHVLVPLHDYTYMKNGMAANDLPDDVLQKITLGQQSPIKIIRKYRGLTQDDLANAAGLSRPYLTEIETGRKEGSIRSLKSIAKALNVPLERLA